MAQTMASAFSSHDTEKATARESIPTKVATSSSRLEHGISPGRKIELQEKLFNQIDMLHKMYERGAITSSQFETRRENLFSQMDKL